MAGMTRLPTGSPAEILLAVQLTQAGIPFQREYRFAPPRRWRADFLVSCPPWPKGGQLLLRPLFIEIDGGAYSGGHKRGRAYESECEKSAHAAILGYRVIHAAPAQVSDGRCLAWIRQALGIEVAA